MAGRIAGDNPGYTFRLCRMGGKGRSPIARPTQWGFDLVSVSTFIGDVMGKPAGAMSYWGFRIGMQGVMEALAAGEDLGDLEADDMEALLKARGVSPNMRRDEAGDRGNNAHQILEWLVDHQNAETAELDPQYRLIAEAYAEDEERTAGTRYGYAVLDWWDEQVQPYIDSGEIIEVVSERPVWSMKNEFSGTFDLALLWSDTHEGAAPLPSRVMAAGWEILDLKTHKPAAGFTKEGFGPGYVSEAAQIKAYRIAHEEMGLGRTIGQRTIVVREKTVRGLCWLEDPREVSEEFVVLLRQAYDHKQKFEGGEA